MYKPRLLLTVLVALVLVAPNLARADALQGVAPLKDSELAQLCGGFTLPNGIDLNVGIDNRVSLNGLTVANAQFSLNGTTVSTSASGSTHIQGLNGSTDIAPLSAVGTTLITNTANNIALNQVRTITVDVTNLSRANLQSMSALSALQSQAINGLKNGLH